jgi:chromatin remodeling complex protein RSC6
MELYQEEQAAGGREEKRTLINADDALKVVFGGKKQVSMFEMTKLVSGHVK